MSKVRFQQSISLDGYSAGSGQSEENPLGAGGEELHDWMVGARGLAQGPRQGGRRGQRQHPGRRGAGVGLRRARHGPEHVRPDRRRRLGRRVLEGLVGRQPSVPHARLRAHPSRSRAGGDGGRTTYHFVTDGIGSAIEQAREAAADEDVLIAGGANTIQQSLAAGLVDEFLLSVVPRLLGDGERLHGVGAELELEQLEGIGAPGVTHLRYRVVKRPT